MRGSRDIEPFQETKPLTSDRSLGRSRSHSKGYVDRRLEIKFIA
ncbi:hypothetical protein CKA32_000915 [Geitlerinema sp. FC II]|nr:hypothetical protein CKA32_000915 [Geitlerinema sp. FC II]